MAEFRIGQFRYTWLGPWITGTDYKRDDVISYGGNSYVCIRTHTADDDFYFDLTFTFPGETNPSPAWVLMTQGISWQGPFQGATQYNVGDLVLFGGSVYACIEGHISGTSLNDDVEKWEAFVFGRRFLGEWQPNTAYGLRSIVKYNGIVYLCINGHTSASTVQGLEANQSDWQIFYENIEYQGTWATAVRYRENDLVTYSGSLLRCVEGHTSGFFDSTKWAVELYGQVFDEDWSDVTYYGIGSVVKYGGYLFYAREDNFARDPINSIYTSYTLENFWVPLSKGFNFRGEWVENTGYRIGDLVRRGGNLYVALINIDSTDSTLDYLDPSNWKLVAPGQNWRKEWNTDVLYAINDLVVFEGSLWSASTAHVSSEQNYPGDNGSGFDYWSLVLEVPQRQGMRLRGDMLTYDLSRDMAADGSTFGPARVPIDEPGKALTIDPDNSVYYDNFGVVSRTFHVSPDGVDDTTDPLRGSLYRPWRTIRYACEQADDGFAGFTTVDVEVGLYEEILPIIVPARTVILGAELRSTTIRAAGPISALALDRTYTIASLARISTLIPALILNQPVEKTTGNPLDPTLAFRDIQVGIPFDPPEFDLSDPQNPVEIFNGFETVTVTAVGNTASASAVQTLIQNIINYINFYLANGTTDPVVVGTNTATTNQFFLDAALILNANKDFLAEEAVAYMIATFPSYEFDADRCKRDIHRYVEAWLYDITYTGNYKSILAARYYRNAVLGSATEDMFYLRDATGVRNCTLKGLEGILNPPTAFDLYQRPTGGAYCSLDPGWGPDDDRTWILTRSPYIQGVSTFGTACVGQKIDGALHNGGNKSMVSNDFTQVLSDGIGAWVRNNGRAELVSVFTYYCAIGYFAEDGGIIRATNGNCSYGNYGAIADGVDLTETPASTMVNNRNQDAIVESTFAGEFNDEIQAFEYRNAGANYTSAQASIIGAGVGATVQFEDFRDDAMFEVLLKDTSTGISQIIGGSGFSVAQNNAQPHLTPGGDAYSITLASNDENEESDYLGKRVIITGGTGTGQYGYVTAYNTTTKVLSVSRESDDQPGWDHVVPGTIIKVPLDTTTFYRIEPRPIISAPPFVATATTIPASSNWANIVYGETYAVYNNVQVEYDAEEVDPALVNEFVPRFNVVKRGRDYELTLISGGVGFAVNDELTILGTKVGGASPINDITVTVTAVSEDSTNPVTEFTHTGLAASGLFVTSTLGGFVGVYSRDGLTWPDTFSFPSFGDWKCLAAVTERGASELNSNVRFVAIRSNSNVAASSLDGITWTARTMPASRLWSAVCYGGGKFVAVSSNSNSFAYSTNGTTWTLGVMPTFGDSSTNEWVDICYGRNQFVAIANSNNVCATSPDGINWTIRLMDVIADSSSRNWVSIAYGRGRFVAMSSQGDVGYSFDGIDWLPGQMPSPDGSTMMNWKKMRYGNGIFFAVCDTGGQDIAGDPTAGPTTIAAQSGDGVYWETKLLATSANWGNIAFGNPYTEQQDSSIGKNTPMWVALAPNSNIINRIRTGARAKTRVTVGGGVIGRIKIWDPGSGYIDAPTLQIVDPNQATPVSVECRIADGVLAQPTRIDKGTGYRTTTTRVTITGDGYAEVYPTGKFVTLTDLEHIPGPGAQITFSTLDTLYTTVAISNIETLPSGKFQARFRISPELKIRDQLEHDTSAIIRERYSQCRITGHDFLDIGSGNFVETNYPELYSGLYFSAEENEVYEESGGRVFYTSTDQSGNFRTGELFAVEQATGIVTISADFFDFSGLDELRLGGIRVGGTGAVIREFSTDPTFTEDSNNIVPTQRAISSYLAARLSVGGSEIATASFIAGLVLVGPDRIGHTLQGTIVLPRRMDFVGPEAGVRGVLMAQGYMMRTVDDMDMM